MHFFAKFLTIPLYYTVLCLEKVFVPPEETKGAITKTFLRLIKCFQAAILLPCALFSIPLSICSYIPYGIGRLFKKIETKEHNPSPLPTDKTLQFIGTATAAMQIRPRDHLQNNWTKHIPEHIQKTVYISKEHEHQMVAELINSGITAYRFSLEWSEIQNRDFTFNQEAIDKVKQDILKFKKAGIKTLTLTLHHFTDPIWLNNGFEDTKTIFRFLEYFKKMFDEFSYGDAKVDHIITLNEPNVYAYMGWIFKTFPPHKFNPNLAGRVLKNMLTAHMECMRAIKNHPHRKNVLVGFAYQALSFLEYHNKMSSLEGVVCRFLSELHHAVIRFLKTGTFTYKIPFCANISEQLADKDEPILDCFFLQHYGRPALRWHPFSLNPKKWLTSTSFPGEQMNDFDFRIDPTDLLHSLKECHSLNPRLPIIISENGIPAHEGDKKRELYMNGAMNSVAQALKEDIPLLGYYHWSLPDNFEWGRNKHDIRFGIYYQKPDGTYAIKPEAKNFLNTVSTWHRKKSLQP